MIRLIACVDFETDDLKDAYRQLRARMNMDPRIGWETSDEWYRGGGLSGPRTELQAAILAVLEKEDG